MPGWTETSHEARPDRPHDSLCGDCGNWMNVEAITVVPRGSGDEQRVMCECGKVCESARHQRGHAVLSLQPEKHRPILPCPNCGVRIVLESGEVS